MAGRGTTPSSRRSFGTNLLACLMSPLRILTLVAAALLVIVGALVILGYIGAVVPDARLRITVGIILVLMGLYRAALGLGRGRDRDDSR